MKDLLLKQIQFKCWASISLLKKLKGTNHLNPKAQFLFSHILSAGSVWLNRLKNEVLSASLFEDWGNNIKTATVN